MAGLHMSLGSKEINPHGDVQAWGVETALGMSPGAGGRQGLASHGMQSRQPPSLSPRASAPVSSWPPGPRLLTRGRNQQGPPPQRSGHPGCATAQGSSQPLLQSGHHAKTRLGPAACRHIPCCIP